MEDSSTDHQANYFSGLLTRKMSSADKERLISTVLDANVEPLPYQIEAALFAFRSPFSTGAVLADEVGLGKTIEAGIVISQKWAERKRAILIVAPANLRQQWAGELLNKFHLPSVVLDSEKVKKHQNIYDSFLNDTKIAIVSYHFVVNHQDIFMNKNWDLVVIDEAHKLRNVYKKDNKMSNAIKKTFDGRNKLLLTATPLQNSLLELYGLVSIIDDKYFGHFETFKDEYSKILPGKRGEKKFTELKNRLRPVVCRTLRKQVQEYVNYTERRANTQQFTPTFEEKQLYEMVTEYLSRDELYAFSSSQRSLITLLLLKLLGSSSYAISFTLESISNRIRAESQSGIRRDNSGKIKIHFDEDLIDSVEEEGDIDLEQEDKAESVSDHEIRAMISEADELHEMANLAKSITHESKGDALLVALKNGFEQLPKYKAQKKALIFTESTRTQAYLIRLLEANGYAGKVVAFNGSGGGDAGNEIYKKWLEKNKDTDKISGVKSADRRAAITDCFRDEAEIMVATEAAGEGMNLQFCSMIINYDLPWNPQRVEQRIGRCHRMGQKSDVLVFNFLNKENKAEQRILELLSEKFKLFDGVFGASDEILGVIESGFEFEKNIAEIIISGVRNPEKINEEFDKLQQMYKFKIDKDTKLARKNLLENFDSDVQQRLKIARGENEHYMNLHTEWLWDVSKYILRDHAEFSNDSFILKKVPEFAKQPIPTGVYSYAKEAIVQHYYRANHPLAIAVLEKAKQLGTPDGHMDFTYTGSHKKITDLERYIGMKGFLTVKKYTRESEVQNEEYYIALAKTIIGDNLPNETAAKILSLPAKFTRLQLPECDFSNELDKEIKRIEEESSQRDSQLMNEEFAKIESRINDVKRGYRLKIKKMDNELKQLKKDYRLETDMKKRLDIQRQQIMLKRKLDEEESAYRQRSRAADDEMLDLNDKIRASIESKPDIQTLFTISWSLK